MPNYQETKNQKVEVISAQQHYFFAVILLLVIFNRLNNVIYVKLGKADIRNSNIINKIKLVYQFRKTNKIYKIS